MPEEVTLCLSRGFIRLVAATPGDFAAPDLSEAGLAAYVDAFGLNSINPEFVAPAQAAVAAVAAVAAALNPEESDDPLGSAGANDEGDDGSLDLSATPPPERRVEWLRRRRARRTVAKAKDKEQFGVNGRVLMEHFNGSRLSGFRDAGEAHHEVDWQWPHTGEERTRYRVFEHLWERGLSITEGCKFGGQYLCYDGGPLFFFFFFFFWQGCVTFVRGCVRFVQGCVTSLHGDQRKVYPVNSSLSSRRAARRPVCGSWRLCRGIEGGGRANLSA